MGGIYANELRVGLDFHRGRNMPVSLYWRQIPLRDGLKEAAAAHRMAVFLDRRVDPGQRCSCQVDDQPWQLAMRHIAKELGLGVGYVGPVTVLGPPETVAVLATLAERANVQQREAAKGPADPTLETSPLTWPRLARPRQMALDLARSAGCSLPQADSIPHDLWDSGELPPLTWSEKLTLILSGFDLHFRLDRQAREVLLIPLPKRASIERVYRVPGPANEVARQLHDLYPRAFLRVEGKRLHMRSLLEDHWSVGDQFQRDVDDGRSPGPAGNGEKRYTLTVQDEPLGALLKVLAHRVDCDLEIIDVAPDQLAQRVSFAVRDVKLSELFTAATAPASLVCTIEGTKITVRPADSDGSQR